MASTPLALKSDVPGLRVLSGVSLPIDANYAASFRSLSRFGPVVTLQLMLITVPTVTGPSKVLDIPVGYRPTGRGGFLSYGGKKVIIETGGLYIMDPIASSDERIMVTWFTNDPFPA